MYSVVIGTNTHGRRYANLVRQSNSDVEAVVYDGPEFDADVERLRIFCNELNILFRSLKSFESESYRRWIAIAKPVFTVKESVS